MITKSEYRDLVNSYIDYQAYQRVVDDYQIAGRELSSHLNEIYGAQQVLKALDGRVRKIDKDLEGVQDQLAASLQDKTPELSADLLSARRDLLFLKQRYHALKHSNIAQYEEELRADIDYQLYFQNKISSEQEKRKLEKKLRAVIKRENPDYDDETLERVFAKLLRSQQSFLYSKNEPFSKQLNKLTHSHHIYAVSQSWMMDRVATIVEYNLALAQMQGVKADPLLTKLSRLLKAGLSEEKCYKRLERLAKSQVGGKSGKKQPLERLFQAVVDRDLVELRCLEFYVTRRHEEVKQRAEAPQRSSAALELVERRPTLKGKQKLFQRAMEEFVKLQAQRRLSTEQLELLKPKVQKLDEAWGELTKWREDLKALQLREKEISQDKQDILDKYFDGQSVEGPRGASRMMERYVEIQDEEIPDKDRKLIFEVERLYDGIARYRQFVAYSFEKYEELLEQNQPQIERTLLSSTASKAQGMAYTAAAAHFCDSSPRAKFLTPASFSADSLEAARDKLCALTKTSFSYTKTYNEFFAQILHLVKHPYWKAIKLDKYSQEALSGLERYLKGKGPAENVLKKLKSFCQRELKSGSKPLLFWQSPHHRQVNALLQAIIKRDFVTLEKLQLEMDAYDQPQSRRLFIEV